MVAGLMIFFVALAFFANFATSYDVGPNYRNVSIGVTVNITDAKPELLSVIIEDPVTLVAGSTYPVACNATVQDFKGFGNIVNVNATFYHESTTFNGPADNNTHYFNPDCTFVDGDGFQANYTCVFDVYYYANPDEWTCMVYAENDYGFTDNLSNTTTVNELLALNVTPLIDYGDLAVEDTSTPQEANVTNLGNSDINVSVYGYGDSPGDGLAMVCDIGDIAVDNQRFSLDELGDFNIDYASLAATPSLIAGLTLQQQTDPNQQVTNQTYWRLYVPPNPFGVCNGIIVFQAESAN